MAFWYNSPHSMVSMIFMLIKFEEREGININAGFSTNPYSFFEKNKRIHG